MAGQAFRCLESQDGGLGEEPKKLDALLDQLDRLDLQRFLSRLPEGGQSPEFRLVVDRHAATDLGINSGEVAGAIGPLVSSRAVSSSQKSGLPFSTDAQLVKT